MPVQPEQSIIKVLAYFDIFNYRLHLTKYIISINPYPRRMLLTLQQLVDDNWCFAWEVFIPCNKTPHCVQEELMVTIKPLYC